MKFGTDGVRGRVDVDITVDDVAGLGRVIGQVFATDRVVVGCDTRESGAKLVAALTSGFGDVGVRVQSLGVAPTPAVAYVARVDDIPGVVVSASHNPWYDNGIKVFAPGGTKLDDRTQAAIEAGLQQGTGPAGAAAAEPASAEDVAPRLDDYLASVVATVEPELLSKLAVVVDCGHGAASFVAPRTLEPLVDTLTVLHAAPDGRNINEACGSTDLGPLSAAVSDTGADVGIAFDGDADRLLAVDETGAEVDGDHIIAILADDFRGRGRLADDTVVVTVMTNLGFRIAMAERSIRVVETAVGDRNVLEALDRGGWSLGGEQSGHVIFRDLATTGDGLLTAVQFLAALTRRGEPLSEIARGAMTRLPQVLENVTVDRPIPDISVAVSDAVAAVEQRLGDRGRVLIRPSGTEPVVRVMVEAHEAAIAAAAAAELVDAVRRVAARFTDQSLVEP